RSLICLHTAAPKIQWLDDSAQSRGEGGGNLCALFVGFVAQFARLGMFAAVATSASVRNNPRRTRAAPQTPAASQNRRRHRWRAGCSQLSTKSIQTPRTPVVRAVQQCAVAAALVLVAGSGGTARAQEPRVTLAVKPVLCITDEREESCALSILVEWRSSRPGSYCLHNDLTSAPLRCWQLAEGGMV